MQGIASAALKTRVALEALTAMVYPAFWKAGVVLLAALVALMVPTPRVALAALLELLMARVVLVPLTTRVALVAWVALETRKRWDQQP